MGKNYINGKTFLEKRYLCWDYGGGGQIGTYEKGGGQIGGQIGTYENEGGQELSELLSMDCGQDWGTFSVGPNSPYPP